MISSEFAVQQFKSWATRESGRRAREVVITMLAANEIVKISFLGTHPTPSFADEFIGRLAADLGEQAFRNRIRIVEVDPDERPLLQVVIRRRLAGSQVISSKQSALRCFA